MGNAGYGNHDAPPAGTGAQDRPGPEGGSGEESSSPAALGVSPQDQSMPDPPGGDAAARDAVEGRSGGMAQGGEPGGAGTPPAGSHADPRLTNPDATPGAGALTPPGGHDDIDSTSA
jgi:hypothetical protein